ncbi:MAG: ATP-binding protein, partial [Planctomycetota bacterium]
ADVEEIEKAGVRAAALTQQLLAFSRKQVLQLKVLNINAVVADIQKLLARLLGEDISLTLVPSAQPVRVRADAGHLAQVLVNLAVNARDAMPKGGKLAIEISPVHMDAAYAHNHGTIAPGDYVMLAVSDTGFGMNAEIQSHLFEPFFTTKERGKGTGLGLSTVYGIVTQNGGHVAVYSEEGRGTVIKVYLPLVTDSLGAGSAPPAAQEGLFSGPGTI